MVANLTSSLPSGNAITISADDVTLDLQGFSIDNTSSGLGTKATAVFGTGFQRLIVRNGRLNGFFQAVVINGASDTRNLIEDLQIYDSRANGIEVSGNLNDIRNCRIVNVGGSGTGYAAGINLGGSRSRARGNWVENVFETTGQTIGINANGSELRLSDNTILNIQGAPDANRGVTCQGSGIRIFGNDIVVPTGQPGSAWTAAACQDLGGNTYTGLPPG